MILFEKLADQEDSRLTSQNNHLLGSKTPGSFKNQRWRDVRKQSKRAINLATVSYSDKPQAGECVNFFFPAMSRWTGS